MTEESVIQFENASIFQDDHLVLSNVNFSLAKDEFVYLIGRVGSGKSSLIKTINAELPLKTGSATVVGFQLEALKAKQIPLLRRKLGIVFQDFQLLTDRSVYENLHFVLHATGWKEKDEIDACIKQVLEKVDLENKGYKMPHQLSGGEQQRVVIARALLNDPEVILADEPTGNLDPETSEGIMKLLREISENGHAVLMSTHNYTLLKKFPARTLKCEEGRMVQMDDNTEIDFTTLE
ncbi:MAG TPA: ATP-binding cassette domain-containing protein [Bacteroidales bacterium]|nr:ATP-binding cassette domain-containing protein [Bacteroidales bacterium]